MTASEPIEHKHRIIADNKSSKKYIRYSVVETGEQDKNKKKGSVRKFSVILRLYLILKVRELIYTYIFLGVVCGLLCAVVRPMSSPLTNLESVRKISFKLGQDFRC